MPARTERRLILFLRDRDTFGRAAHPHGRATPAFGSGQRAGTELRFPRFPLQGQDKDDV